MNAEQAKAAVLPNFATVSFLLSLDEAQKHMLHTAMANAYLDGMIAGVKMCEPKQTEAKS